MRRIISLVAAVLAAGLLAGCYESQSLLLDASAARQPISSFQDWTYNSGDTKYHARLTPRSDGWYDFEEAAFKEDGTEGDLRHYTVLLNFLENAAGLDVYTSAHWEDGDKAYLYGLVAFFPDGRWQSIQPNCDYLSSYSDEDLDKDLAAAKAAGAELVSDEISDICVFSTRDSLLAAMRTIARDPGFRQRVESAID